MNQPYIVDGIRTPIGALAGSLAAVRPDDLAALVIRELMQRNPTIPADAIDEIFFGCANQAGEDNRNVARMAGLLSGLPYSVPAETINLLCASGMAAVASGARSIRSGDGHLFIAGGVESMTRAPFVMSKAPTAYAREVQVFDTSIGWRFVNPLMRDQYGIDSMGETAENVSERYQISREDQDLFAYYTQIKCSESIKRNRFNEEIVEVMIPSRKGEPIRVRTDEFPKPATTMDALSRLKPAFRKEGTVTAGNASGINDGAAALLIASGEALKSHGLKPLARIVSTAVAGVEPAYMGIGPVVAAPMALKKAGIGFKDLDVIELNEAFAAQALACIRQWGLNDDDPRINPNGGAIALGHPLGMTGARLALTAARQLHHTKGKYALCTLCVGVGQGYAMILERV